MSEPTGTQYAGFWARCIALLADSAILFLIYAAVLAGTAMALGTELLAPVAAALSFVALLYWPVMHASRPQATFGKALVGLKVARLDGRRISLLRSAWRELTKVLSAALLLLGYLMAAFMPRKQALHDLLSATYVVNDGPPRIIPALAVAVAAFAVPIVAGPLVVPENVTASITRVAEEVVAEHLLLVSQHVPGMEQLARPAPKPVAKAPPKPPVAKAAPRFEPKAEPKVEPKVEPKAEPKVEPVATPAPPPPVAVPAPVVAAAPVIEPAPPVVAEPAKPKAAPRKPKADAKSAPVRVAKAAPTPTEAKRVSGPKYNDLMTAVLYRDAESVSELLKLGKWVDKPDSRGATPLMVAAELGDVRTAEALLRGGANAGLALRTAEERSDAKMLALLKRYTKR